MIQHDTKMHINIHVLANMMIEMNTNLRKYNTNATTNIDVYATTSHSEMHHNIMQYNVA